MIMGVIICVVKYFNTFSVSTLSWTSSVSFVIYTQLKPSVVTNDTNNDVILFIHHTEITSPFKWSKWLDSLSDYDFICLGLQKKT